MGFLSIDALSIHFGGLAALSGVSLEVAEGEIFALIGPNGAGKTTILNVLTGLYRPTGGRVSFRGEDLGRLPPHEIARRGIARTFQNTEVFRRLSALDHVLIGAHARLTSGVFAGALNLPSVRREEAESRRRGLALLARVGLEESAGLEAASLPLGFQKRLEIARALASEPRLLLLDEPAGGLNPTERQALMDLIVRLRREESLTIVVVEHNMELVMSVSDRVAVLHYGRKIAEGKPREVATDPAVIEAYLGSADDEPDPRA